ncbi:N-acetyltransferase [Nonomuraea diastatica]|uniref:GNAT family N-acetyltransferase n=1 Tax=Nonomuraea diastatica TaxID=1848329 RepID=UPI0026905B38
MASARRRRRRSRKERGAYDRPLGGCREQHPFLCPSGLPGSRSPQLSRVGETPALALAPTAVLPEVQRQGLGTLVIEDALREARARGESAVVVLGHPEYYPRFGFTIASRHGIGVAFDVPVEALMALSLDGAPLPSGTIRYGPPFGV